jgi:hypothetical protein
LKAAFPKVFGQTGLARISLIGGAGGLDARFAARAFAERSAMLRTMTNEQARRARGARQTWMRAAMALVALGAWSVGPTALAQSHNYINYMRSSTTTAVFVQQSVDGEFGKFTLRGENKATDATADATGDAQASGPAKAPGAYEVTQRWRGYGIGTTVGIETMKFLQFVAGHTFVNLRYRDDALQSLNGSRLHLGGRLAFTAPLVNLEGGAGVQGSRLDYQRQLDNASFYGSGYYYSLGLNYFVSTRVSFYYEAKQAHEHLVRNGGSASIESIDTEDTLMGLGFRLWF